MIIGGLCKYGDVYTGRLLTLGLDATIMIVPAPPCDDEGAPDWHVILGDEVSDDEIGNGWNRIDAESGDCIAIQIDSPVLAAPLRATLLLDVIFDDAHPLCWQRSSMPPSVTS
ncbi:DUF736 domain-containing protein [Sphingopyxis sp. NJF-3]